MLRFKTIIAMMMLAAAAIVAGCESGEETNTGGVPNVILDRYELNVDGNGGDMSIYYGVENAIKGEKPVVKSTADWITPLEVESTKIVLRVATNNDPEQRQAIVNVTYKNMKQPIRIYVTQDKAMLNWFSFEVSDITYKSCTVRYTPTDKTMQYMANVIDREYFNYSGVSTEEAFIQAEMSNYLTIAKSYGMTLEELMQNTTPQLIYTDEAVRTFDGMQHGGKYVVYSYGVTFSNNSYDVTTPIHYTLVELPMPTFYDVNFRLQTKVESTGSAILTISPKDWDGYYNVQIAPDDSLYYVNPGETTDAFVIRALANAFYNNARSYMVQGNSAEKYMSSHCYIGEQRLSIQLEPGKRYMIIVFAVESEDGAIPVMRSMPSIDHIR